jgi:tRNA pseudouridine55 synthase
MKHGFLLVDKPLAHTSHDIVAIARRTLHERKIGHLGTLDPAASGLMVLAIGAKALKTIELFEKASKTYLVTVTLGAVSSSYDADGVVEQQELPVGFVIPTEKQIEQCIAANFSGVITQVPPQHSAIHIAGTRAYELARKGIEVAMPERQVHIYSCSITSYAYPELTLKVECGSGTYIRSLANDLGVLLRCGGYVTMLRRLQLGSWSVDFAVPPESIGWSYVLPLHEVLDNFTKYMLTDAEFKTIGYGQSIPVRVRYPTIGWYNNYPVCMLEPLPDDTTRSKARKVF